MKNPIAYYLKYFLLITVLLTVCLPGCKAPEQSLQLGQNVGYRLGNIAPDFTLDTIDSKSVKLSDFRGKNVILNFWATWCGPCRFEMPFLEAIHEEWAKSDVVVIAVNTQDGYESARSYAKAYNIKFVIPVDVTGKVAEKFAVRGMPTTFFINEEGIITSIKIGPFITVDEIEERMKTFKNADTQIR